jgi:two-component system NarL family response regulator
VTDQVVTGALSPESDKAEPGHLARLGEREREVLQLVAEGMTSGEIASKLFISPSTVDTHRRNIMRKLELHGIADLTRFAVREGLVQAET